MTLARVLPFPTALLLTLAASGAALAQEPSAAPGPTRVRTARSVQASPAQPPAPSPSARVQTRPAGVDYRVVERQLERAERDVSAAERRLQELKARGFASQNATVPAGDRSVLEKEVREREEQLRAAQKALNDARSKLAQERARTFTRSFSQNSPYFFFQTQASPASPEMARKTASLMALRSIVQLGLTRAEIESALPVLKRLQESAKILQDESDRAMEEERAALLAAKPGEVPSSTTSARLREASSRSREEQQKGWDELAKAIGAQKATGLRRLLGESGSVRIWDTRSGREPGANPGARVFGELLTLPEPNLLAPALAIAGAGNDYTIFRGSTISLAELIDLLTQRAAALKE